MMWLARAVMAVAVGCLGDRRRGWAAAMQAEFDTVAAHGSPLRFAFGCLSAGLGEMVLCEEGRLVLSSYGLALAVILPMAALQIGCALFGLPYLYPGPDGLPGALLVGGAHEALIRTVYQAAIPTLTLLLLALGIGQVRIAWAMLERDWARAVRLAMLMLAATVTLLIFMAVLFLNNSQVLLQGAVLAIELPVIALIARWHAQLPQTGAAETAQPG